MPLSNDMESCMKQTKKEFGSHGRSKKPMGKKAAHKQRVAMCLKSAGKSKYDENSHFLTFKEFLLEYAVVSK